MDQRKESAADTGRFGLHHRQRRGDRHRCIHRVAARGENLESGFRGQRVGAGDRGRFRRGLDLAGKSRCIEREDGCGQEESMWPQAVPRLRPAGWLCA